jgi:hypothetical protein
MNTKKIGTALFSGVFLATMLYPVGAMADSNKNKSQNNKNEAQVIAGRPIDTNTTCVTPKSKDQDEIFTRSNVLKEGLTGKAYFQKNSRVGQEARVQLKKLSNKNKNSAAAFATLTTALNTFETNRTNALNTYNNTITALQVSCNSNIAAFKTTLNASVATAKATLNTVITNTASTTIQIQSANDTFKSAVQLANTAYLNSVQPAVTIFRSGSSLAQLTFVNALTLADQILSSATQIARLPKK